MKWKDVLAFIKQMDFRCVNNYDKISERDVDLLFTHPIVPMDTKCCRCDLPLHLTVPIGSEDEFYITEWNWRIKMRNQEEVERMSEATKKELDEILDSERTGDSLQESRRLVLSAQLSILTWMLGRENQWHIISKAHKVGYYLFSTFPKLVIHRPWLLADNSIDLIIEVRSAFWAKEVVDGLLMLRTCRYYISQDFTNSIERRYIKSCL